MRPSMASASLEGTVALVAASKEALGTRTGGGRRGKWAARYASPRRYATIVGVTASSPLSVNTLPYKCGPGVGCWTLEPRSGG